MREIPHIFLEITTATAANSLTFGALCWLVSV
jgi:hypothetical protein